MEPDLVLKQGHFSVLLITLKVSVLDRKSENSWNGHVPAGRLFHPRLQSCWLVAPVTSADSETCELESIPDPQASSLLDLYASSWILWPSLVPRAGGAKVVTCQADLRVRRISPVASPGA